MAYRVLVATPCQDHVAAGFALDLAKLVGYTTAMGVCDLVLMQNRGTIIPQQRQTLAEHAVDKDCTHVLWLDSDMRFPKDALVRFLEHDVPIVAANYPMRRPPILPTAEHREKGSLFTMPEDTGTVPVTSVGMGCMLVQTDVYRTLPKPWFTLGYDPKGEAFVGEDVFFCRRAKEHGFTTLIDQAVSQEVKHVGEMEYTHQHAALTRETWLTRQAHGA